MTILEVWAHMNIDPDLEYHLGLMLAYAVEAMAAQWVWEEIGHWEPAPEYGDGVEVWVIDHPRFPQWKPMDLAEEGWDL